MIRPLKPSIYYVYTVITLLASDAVMDIAYAQQSILSDQCISETEDLATIQAITSKVPSAECTINLDVSNSCTSDFEPISGDFKDACLNGGGRFYTTDVTYDCTTFAYGASYAVNYMYLSFPACFGMSCTNEELKEYYSSNIHPYMEESFAANGLICDVTDKNELSFGNGNKVTNEGSGTSAATTFPSWSISVMTCIMFATAIIAL
jgi:hypothetical protein